MKAILEFNLDEQEDIKSHLRAVMSLNMSIALWELVYNTKKSIIREVETNEIKYNNEPYELIDFIFTRFNEILSENNINVDELID